VLLVGSMVNGTTGMGTSIVLGIGKPEFMVVPNIVMALLNIVCSTVFFYAFGPQGVVWGTAVGLVVASVLYYKVLNRTMGVGNRVVWSSMSIPFFTNIFATLALIKLHDFGKAMNPGMFSGLWSGWGVIAIGSLLALLINVVVYGVTKFITTKELLEYLPFLRRQS